MVVEPNMTVISSTFPSAGQPRKWLASSVFAFLVVFLLVGTLTVCCELFASPTDEAQSQSIAKANKGTSQYDDPDCNRSETNIQIARLTPADSAHCVNKMLLDPAVSKYLAIITPDPNEKIILASYDGFTILSAQVVDIVSPHNEPAPVSPPLYLLFHRLLIAHPLA